MLLILGGLVGCNANPGGDLQRQGYSFWPQAPDLPRVQFLTSFQRSSDVSGVTSKFDDMIYGKEASLPILLPYGVAMWQGKIYVCDTRGIGLTILDLKNRLTRVIGTGAAELSKATDIAIASDGMKYVVDGARKLIVVFDASDRYVKTLGGGSDFDPISVAVYGNELFVCDFKGQIVKVLDRNNGQMLRTLGEAGGAKDGQFMRPLCVRVDKTGQVVVADVLTCRIQRFDREGKFVWVTGKIGRAPGCFERPKHIAIDGNGVMYVADAGFSNVQTFDEEGKVMGFFGVQGSHPGAMDMPAGLAISEDPADIDIFKRYIHPAFDAQRLIVVTNHGPRNKVAVYAQGQLKPGKTLADVAADRAKMEGGLEARGTGAGASELPMIPPDDAGSAGDHGTPASGGATTQPAGTGTR